MALKVYIASITANTEIRKQVQRVMMVLDGMGIDYEAVDITLPGKEKERDFMRTNAKAREGQSVALPPQIFYEDEFIGDYEDFDNAVEDNQLLYFLRLSAPSTATTHDGPAVTQMNGETANGHEEEKGDEEAAEEGEGEDVEDEGEGEGVEDEEGGEEGEEGAEEDGEEKEGDEEEEIVDDPEIEDEEGEGEKEAEKDEEKADAEEEEDVEDVEIEDEEVEDVEIEDEEVEDVEIEDEEEGGEALPLHSVCSLVDCSRPVSRRRRY
uniref:Uncharacterized protein n=1 Tax=Plectus sambesii TaxID=2011161 RepID=A0A914V6M4_9BILA